ncbi:MAG: prepilin-type N-terminal cleavage/methylation domain-containing protein [Oligoflexia bacterium]|nr:prepilin-type N-terminal cleavage/methylation domain-containing protein [Oligoflexia bacterium]
MAERTSNSTVSSAGFTLIEITIAIVIIASAMVIFLGLQSSIVDQTLRAGEQEQAMMLARRILAKYETSDDPLNVGETVWESGKTALEDLDLFSDQDQEQLDTLNHFHIRLTIGTQGIPQLEEDAMKRLDLVIAWGAAPDQRFEVLYYVPNAPAEPSPKPGGTP